MTSKLRKPNLSGKTTVFQSKGARRAGSTSPSGSLSPRSAVFSAGLGPPSSNQPNSDKKLLDELSKVKEERDRFSRQASNAKCQLLERDNEVKNLQKIVDSHNSMPNGVTNTAAEQQNYFKAVIQRMPDGASFDVLDYLQRWNSELLMKIRDQALEIAELTTNRGSGEQDDIVKSLSKQVADLSQRLKDCKSVASSLMSPMSTPPVSPPPKSKDSVTRSASTGYQNAPSLPLELRRLLSSIPEPLSDDVRNRTFLSQLRDVTSRLRISSTTTTPDDSRGYANPNRVTVQTSTVRRSASAGLSSLFMNSFVVFFVDQFKKEYIKQKNRAISTKENRCFSKNQKFGFKRKRYAERCYNNIN